MAATTQGINFKHAENTELSIRVCPVCGVTYAVPERLVEHRRQQGGSWYCPNGHTLSFTETEADRLRKEAKRLERKIEDEKANAAWWRDRSKEAQKTADHQEARANGYKGALTKVKKRVGKGVCPCCNRSFVDLGRHMESKHPAFKEPVT
jgi:predicted GIY-YIG superfamily endonuclease